MSQQKSALAKVLCIVLFGLLWMGCQGTVDPEALSVGPGRNVDRTTFDDLYVWGRLDVGVPNEPSEPGPLDLVLLQTALLATCYDELVDTGVDGTYVDGPVHHVCNNQMDGPYLDFQQEDSCRANVCAAQLYICLGLKNQELAETIEPIEFSTDPFVLLQNEVYPDGSFRFQLDFYSRGSRYQRDGEVHSYTIPPQTPANRTLLWRAATFAYREAGVRSVIASDRTVCTWDLADTGNGVIQYEPVSLRGPDSEATDVDLFVVGLTESLERLVEAAERTTENERSTAVAQSREIGNRYDLVERRWQSEINSEASALALMVGSGNIEAARRVTRPVVVDGLHGPTRRAIALLRDAAVDLDADPDRTDQQVMDDVLQVVDTFNDDPSLAIEPDELLDRIRSNRAEFSLARRYLLEEHRALNRVLTPIEGTGDDGPVRYHGMHEPMGGLPGAALVAMAATAPQNLLMRRSEFEEELVWLGYGPGEHSRNPDSAIGPFDSSGLTTADSLSLTGEASIAQKVEVLPPETTALTFSVFIQSYMPITGDTLLVLEACGHSATRAINTEYQSQWERFWVTLELDEACSDTATVRIAFQGGSTETITFYLWGAQLEQGTSPRTLRPGVDEPVEVLSRSYMEGGVIHAIDALRQAATGVLGEDGFGPCLDPEDCEEYVRILNAAMSEGEIAVGPYRYVAEATGGTTTTVQLYGAAADQDLRIVQGVEGLRCALTGTIDGAGCDIADYILASSANNDFEYTGSTGEPTLADYVEAQIDIQSSDQVFLISGGNVVGGHFEAAGNSTGSFTAPVGGLHTAGPIPFLRTRGDASEPLDVPCDEWMTETFVPPLENELTSDNDDYEDSWRHYLDLARRTASEADLLCEQMIDQGLHMDMRSEEARLRLAELCGASVDEAGQEDCGDDPTCQGRLFTCLRSASTESPNYRIPYVSLGVPVCVAEHTGEYGLCGCVPGTEGCEDGHLPNCPLPFTPDESSADTSDLQCAREMELEGSADHVVSYVPAALELFEGGAHHIYGDPGCDRLETLRGDTGFLGFRERVIEELGSFWWYQPDTLHRIARSVRLEQRFPNHFAVIAGGRTLASTYVAAGQAESDHSNCPLVYPWRPGPEDSDPNGNRMVSRDVYCQYTSEIDADCEVFPALVPNQNHHIACAGVGDNCLEEPTFQCRWNEAFVEEGLNRMSWAEHISWAIMYLDIIGHVNEPRSEMRRMSLRPFGEETRSLVFEDNFSGFPLEITNGENTSHCILLDCDDPRWGTSGYPCHGDSEFRRICHVTGMPALVPDSSPLLFEFADVFMFFGNTLISTSDWLRIPNDLAAGHFLLRERPFASLYLDDTNTVLYGTPILPWTMAGFAGDSQVYDCGSSCERSPTIRSPYQDLVTFDGLVSGGGSSTTYDDIDYVDTSVHTAALWNALELACWVIEQDGSSCEDVGYVAEIDSVEDLNRVAGAVDCLANEIHHTWSRQVLAEVPASLVDGFRRSGPEAIYPDYGGEQLSAMLEVQTGLQRMGTAVQRIEEALQDTADDIRQFQSTRGIAELNQRAELLRLHVAQVSNTVSAVSSVLNSSSNIGSSVMSKNYTGAIASVINIIVAAWGRETVADDYDDLEELTDEVVDAHLRQATIDLSRATRNNTQSIHDAGDLLLDAFAQIQRGLGRIEAIQREADQLLARIEFRDTDAAGRTWSVNTTLRRRENTIRRRYATALRNAKRAGFIARRAIEFRLGEDLHDMTSDLHLVEAPSTWVDDLCSMHGCDYDRISDGGVIDDDLAEDHYVDAYVGDYVTRLENLVESYPIDFPFNDSQDITVISLRELVASQEPVCWTDDGVNLLYHSGDLWRSHTEEVDSELFIRGWEREGCVVIDDDPPDGPTEADYCLRVVGNDSLSCDGSGRSCQPGDLLQDTPDNPERSADATTGGFVRQRVGHVTSGNYELRFDIRDATATVTEDGTPSPQPYLVQIVSATDGSVLAWHQETLPSASGFESRFLPLSVEALVDDLIVEIHPSSVDCLVDETSCNLGAIWVDNVQLNSVSHCDPFVPACLPIPYYPTTHTRGQYIPCATPNEYAFQDTFERICEDLDGDSCDPLFGGGCQCYREVSFQISLSQVENGELFQSAVLASRNYNYRHGATTLNLQGSNVLGCDPEAPSSCYSNGSVLYTLEHSGAEMPIRNWDGDTELFSMPTGRIQAGRALADEVVATNPLSSTQRGLFTDYWKRELRGRPLQGQYTLRIWEDDALQWWNLEDVQLVLDYRYWTRFGQ